MSSMPEVPPSAATPLEAEVRLNMKAKLAIISEKMRAEVMVLLIARNHAGVVRFSQIISDGSGACTDSGRNPRPHMLLDP